MATVATNYGLPQVIIDFRTKGVTAIARSARGVVALLIHCESEDKQQVLKINDVTDIPGEFDETAAEIIKLCLQGTPSKVLVYTLPTEDVGASKNTLASTLAKLKHVRYNYLACPAGTQQDMNDIASYIKTQRQQERKTVKAVLANVAGDHEGIINFTATGIKVDAGKDAQGVQQYTEYETNTFTARIVGILAGLALDRSATYFRLTDVVSVDLYDDISEHIKKGELCLFDEEDGDGVKIARAINSLVTYTTDRGDEFRKIKIIEGIDMVMDDIRDTFKHSYVGKYINDYNHKMLFVSAVLVYFNELAGNVLDAAANNVVDINEQWQKNYAIIKGEKVEDMSAMDIRKYNTGDSIALTGSVKFVDAMENLTIDFTI